AVGRAACVGAMVSGCSRVLGGRVRGLAVQFPGFGLNRANILPFGSVRYATTMPSPSSIGATTTLPPSSSLRAAVAATSATWTTKTAYGGMLPPVLKIPPEGPAAPGAVMSVYAPSGANDQPKSEP